MEENKDSLDKIEAGLKLAIEGVLELLIEVLGPIFESMIKCVQIFENYILDNEKEIIKDHPELKIYIDYLKKRLKDEK